MLKAFFLPKFSVPSLPVFYPTSSLTLGALIRSDTACDSRRASGHRNRGRVISTCHYKHILPRQFCQCSLIIRSRSQSAPCIQGCNTCCQSVVPLQLLTFFPQPSDLQVSFVEGMAENLAGAFLQAADLQNTGWPVSFARSLTNSTTTPFGEGYPALPGHALTGLSISDNSQQSLLQVGPP